MEEIDPDRTFRGLPLTAEQDAEVRHYIKHRIQHGLGIDARELRAMLKDMLSPPDYDDLDLDKVVGDTVADAERAAAAIDEAMDPIEASEERNAAMELEAMKRLNR